MEKDMYPEIALRRIKDFHSKPDGRVFGMIKSLNAFCCMGNERAFNRGEAHDNSLADTINSALKRFINCVTFLEQFLPTSLRVWDASGTGERGVGWHYSEGITLRE